MSRQCCGVGKVPMHTMENGILMKHQFQDKQSKSIMFGLEILWGQSQLQFFLSPWATTMAFHLDCSAAAIPTPQKVSFNWKLVELTIRDFSNQTGTGISSLTLAADNPGPFEDPYSSSLHWCQNLPVLTPGTDCMNLMAGPVQLPPK